MSQHLALCADNSPSRPSVPRPGYRQALATGTCQKCKLPDPGVRTAGIRRPSDAHWLRVALCPACVVLGRAQGLTVIS